ncbi:hypothetical protein [Streptomyces sp. NPDC046939]|uniref:hypothetical protein n=1 Tax=Streptomyces sp. NPDC046939 TaxID=3155376 RepID=UPI0033FB86B4
MRFSARAVGVAAGFGAGVGLLGIGAPSAAAADACVTSGPATYCHNVYGAPVYGSYDGTGQVVGRMYTTYSWFSCRLDKGGYVGGPHPYRWLLTKADNGVWGWMKDTSISSETDSVIPC